MNVLNYSDYENTRSFDAEVVVVGTGAGGATIGAELAEAGVDVLFVEEGGYHPTASFNPYMSESGPRLMRDGGASVILGNPPIQFAEGRCVGGSTTINGGMAYRAPAPILDRWVQTTGNPDFAPKHMDTLFSRVEDYIHAKDQLPESRGDDSRIMHQGAQKLGWHSEINKRNQNACVGTNNCIFGCPTGGKQSTLVSYMPRAMKAGARCLTEIRVESLIIKNGRCVGIEGRAYNPHTRKKDRKITVHAKAVVVACGAVQTPHLLLKHRLGRPSGQLGRNFLCHPNAKVAAVYPFEVKAWQGVSQWSQVREFREDGILMAENFIPPSVMAASVPYHGEKSWEVVKNYNNMATTGVLVEDSSSGRIVRGPLDMALPLYNITALDHRRFLRGIKLLATIHFTMGADYVMLPFTNLHVCHSIDELRRIDATQKSPATLELFTVHLMGTARMGCHPEQSVVDLNGELWDLPGCYVADASIFPTAIGVNPQVTIMAMATQIAARMVNRLGHVRRAAA